MKSPIILTDNLKIMLNTLKITHLLSRKSAWIMLLYAFQRKKHSCHLTVYVPLIETEHILLDIITLSYWTLLIHILTCCSSSSITSHHIFGNNDKQNYTKSPISSTSVYHKAVYGSTWGRQEPSFVDLFRFACHNHMSVNSINFKHKY